MTTYSWPSGYYPETFELKLAPNARVIRPMFDGRPQSIEFVGARWRASLTLPPDVLGDRGEIEGFFNRIRGPAHRVSLWHLARPVPRGTLQANTTTNTTAAQFDSSVSFAAPTGLTLLAGDMVGVALADSTTQLVQLVTAATAAAGSMTATFTPPLRWSVSNGAAITVVKPTATFMLAEAPAFLYQSPNAPALPITLEEA